jgi:hypothetical protein
MAVAAALSGVNCAISTSLTLARVGALIRCLRLTALRRTAARPPALRISPARRARGFAFAADRLEPCENALPAVCPIRARTWARFGVRSGCSRPERHCCKCSFDVDFSMVCLERAMGFEPTTPTLARLCSTPELHPHPQEGKAFSTIGHAELVEPIRNICWIAASAGGLGVRR